MFRHQTLAKNITSWAFIIWHDCSTTQLFFSVFALVFSSCTEIMLYHKTLIIIPQGLRGSFSFQKLCKGLGLFRKGEPSFKSHKGGLNETSYCLFMIKEQNVSGQASNWIYTVFLSIYFIFSAYNIGERRWGWGGRGLREGKCAEKMKF